MKSKSIILLAVSLGFGLVAAFGISQVLGRGGGKAEAPPQKMKSVLIAKETIDQWGKFTEENIEVKEWPEELVPEDAITSMEELTDLIARSRVPKNSPLLLDHVIDKNATKNVDIRPGHTVISINVDTQALIGGLLQPGHRVDIMAVFQAPSKNGGNTVFARTFLRNIRVYAIDSQMAVSEESNAASATVISVEVTKKQAEKIVLVQRVASLKIALVGDEPGSEEDDGEGTDLVEVLTGNNGRANFEDAQVAQTQRAVERENQSQPSLFAPTNNEPEKKKYKMTIVGASGVQTYRWQDGEMPALHDPAAQAVPENDSPFNLPPGVNPPGMEPPTKGNDEANSESKSGSNVSKKEDEFGE